MLDGPRDSSNDYRPENSPPSNTFKTTASWCVQRNATAMLLTQRNMDLADGVAIALEKKAQNYHTTTTAAYHLKRLKLCGVGHAIIIQAPIGSFTFPT